MALLLGMEPRTDGLGHGVRLLVPAAAVLLRPLHAARQVLNAKSSFGPYMWAPVLNNIVAIGGLAVFILIFGTNNASPHDLSTWAPDKIALIAGTATLGVAAQALILIWPLKRIGFKYKPTFGFRGVGLASAGKVAFWTFAAMLIGQLGFLVISRVASGASVPG